MCGITIRDTARGRSYFLQSIFFCLGRRFDFFFKQILQAIGIDYIDESEVLTPADDEHHINKHNFKVPFVCGARNLGEALRRIGEGAAFIRTKGEAGTGNVVEA